MLRVDNKAEPFFIPGDETGCLLIHGFTATPHVMGEMGQFLASEGFTVLGVRLAGHGRRPRDLARTCWEDWLASARDGLHQLQHRTTRQIAIGHSIGGALGLLLSLESTLAGVACIATPVEIPNAQVALLRRLPHRLGLQILRAYALLRPYIGKEQGAWFEPSAAHKYVSYAKYPTRAIAELWRMQHHLRARLAKIRAPVSLIYSRDDDFVPLSHMDAIYQGLGTLEKHHHVIERSNHILPLDAGREQVFHITADFVRGLEKRERQDQTHEVPKPSYR